MHNASQKTQKLFGVNEEDDCVSLVIKIARLPASWSSRQMQPFVVITNLYRLRLLPLPLPDPDPVPDPDGMSATWRRSS